MSNAADPIDLSARITIDAAPEKVWSVLSDVTRMPEFSPELRRVVVLGRRREGVGTQFVGVNRRKWLVWPTTSKVVRFEPVRAIGWRTRESGATWIYELEESAAGTAVTSRRELPGFTVPSKLMTPLMGGALNHDRELGDGLRLTLERIKAAVES